MLDKQLTTQDQKFLTAALCQGEQAKEAWEAWRATIDFDKYGPRYMPFIPLLYENLLRAGIDDPLLRKFKGIRRKIWYQNQLHLRQASSLLSLWQKSNIQPLCFGDLALVSYYYKKSETPPVRMQRFLFRPEQIHTAAQLLSQHGWVQKRKKPMGRKYIYTNSDKVNVELCKELFPPHLYSADVDSLWNNKIPIQLHDAAAHTVSPTDQLFHLCAQPPPKNFYGKLWIADALTLLRNSEIEIDWEQITSPNENHHLQKRLQSSFTELWMKYDGPIPSEAVSPSPPSQRTIRSQLNMILRHLGMDKKCE